MKSKKNEIIPLAQQRPLRSLVKGAHRQSGRNSQGRITVRYQGGGVKQLYRSID